MFDTITSTHIGLAIGLFWSLLILKRVSDSLIFEIHVNSNLEQIEEQLTEIKMILTELNSVKKKE